MDNTLKRSSEACISLIFILWKDESTFHGCFLRYFYLSSVVLLRTSWTVSFSKISGIGTSFFFLPSGLVFGFSLTTATGFVKVYLVMSFL